ncbi:flagellar hook-associated protein FlgL [bacterium]|nr:flagellar hook-associated protein FlgL [bacterium]
MRVTENLITRNFLSHSSSALSRMAAAQERLASGKNLLRPSDDPRALAKSLALNGDLRRAAAYGDNASSATAFMSMTESSLQEISDLLSRSKELVIAAQNATSDDDGADAQARELRSLVDSLLLVANRDIGGRNLFGGQQTRGKAYSQLGGHVVYGGDSRDILEELGNGLRIAVNVTGPTAFETVPSTIRGTVDLDPALSTITGLGDLLDGNGISPGSIRITDGNGVIADVNLGGSETMGAVLDAINAAGTGVVAAIAADGQSIELTDTTGGGSFQVEDILGGGFARATGLATTSTTGSIRGIDLDPAVSANTPLALLRGGAGIATSPWTLRTERAGETLTATIDPSTANTLGDLLAMVNGAVAADGTSLGIHASIDGRNLLLESVNLQTTIGIDDSPPGGGASQLGIAGLGEVSDVFALLERAAQAVQQRDNDAMDDAIRDVTRAIEQTSGMRGTYGARSRQVLSLAENLRDQQVDLTIRLSDVEDADLAEAAIQLTQAETIYNAALTTGTRMLEMSLFNYIR